MNVWGMGIIMWQLAMLDDYPPHIDEAAMGTLNIYVEIITGVIYGHDLDAHNNYSGSLKGFIFSCLF